MDSFQHPWSEWAWSPSDKQWYRYRQNDQAPQGLEYEWNRGHDAAEPRTTADAVDLLADRVAHLRYSTAGSVQAEVPPAGEYQYSNDPQHSKPSKLSRHDHYKSSKAAQPSKHKDKEREKKYSSKRRPKEDERRELEDSNLGAETEYSYPEASYDQDRSSVAWNITESFSAKGKGKMSEPEADRQVQKQYASETRHHRQLHDVNEQVAFDESGDVSDQEVLRIMEDSKKAYNTLSRGESSSAGGMRPYASANSEEEIPASPSATEYESVMGARPGETMVLDPRYRVEHSSKFAPGMVFKILWPEPQGINQAPSIPDKQMMDDGYGGSIHVGFRRFIVVANDAGHCHCVPILTYGGRACKKRGVKPEKHGIVHDVTKSGKPLDKEPKLGFPPVRVQMVVDGETLRRESRVNYSKLHPVEHNYKVFFIGTVVEDDLEAVRFAVNYCWENKKHTARR